MISGGCCGPMDRREMMCYTKPGLSGGVDFLFTPDGVMSAEYRLLAQTAKELSQWGNMIADIVHKGPHGIVLIENKIGIGFSHGGSVNDGQIAQYFRFLIDSLIRPASFVLLTSAELVN